MHNLPFTADLTAAFRAITGTEPAQPDRLTLVSGYVDLLAKEYGLSDSLAIDVDPIERTEQAGAYMQVVTEALGTVGVPLTADAVRARIYSAVLEIAADPQARAVLNRNQPLTESRVLYLAQVYWNLEARDGRLRLPIEPGGGRDIPVPGSNADFATMKWTDRVNQKTSQKSSGQSFRIQGARLAVLVARHCTAGMSQVPLPEFDVRPTSNPDQPVEVAPKELAATAASMGQFGDAFDLSTAYLSMVSRRAEQAPLDHELDLADAHFWRGVHGGSRWREDEGTLDPLGLLGRTSAVVESETAAADLERAEASLRTLRELDPGDSGIGERLYPMHVFRGLLYRSVGRSSDAVEAFHAALSVHAGLSAPSIGFAQGWGRPSNLLMLYIYLAESLTAIDRADEAVVVSSKVAELALSLDAENPDSSLVRSRIWSGWVDQLSRLGQFSESLRVANEAVAFFEQSSSGRSADRSYLVEALDDRWKVLSEMGRQDEAREDRQRMLDLLESAVDEDPASVTARWFLIAALAYFGDDWDVSRSSDADSGPRDNQPGWRDRIVEAAHCSEPVTEDNVLVYLAVAEKLSDLVSELESAARVESARRAMERSLAILTDSSMILPTDGRAFAWAVAYLADVCNQSAASGHRDVAVAAAEVVAGLPPRALGNPVFDVGSSQVYEQVLFSMSAEAMVEAGQFDLAVSLASRGYEEMLRLPERSSDSWRANFMTVFPMLVGAFHRANRAHDGGRVLREATEILGLQGEANE